MARRCWPLAAILTVMLAASLASGGHGCGDALSGGDACRSDCGAGRGCGLFGRRCRGTGEIDGLDAHFNCGCNGSYNYPVPPLYTYHWPGMYKQQLVTDYRSPWRFPPLKPYVDELPVQSASWNIPALRPIPAMASEISAERQAEIEPISSRLMRAAHR